MSNPIDSLIRRIAERILELLPPRDSGDDDDDEQPPELDPDPDSDVTITAVNGVHSQDSTSSSFWFNFSKIRPLTGTDENALEFDTADRTQSYQQASGIKVELDGTVLGLECQLSERVDSVTRAWVEQDGETVAEADLSDTDGGDTFEFDSALEAGTYRLLVDAGGSEEFDRARGQADYPVDNRREPEAIELPEDGEGQTGHSNYCGVAIVPTEDISGLEVRLGGDKHDGAKDITALHVFDDEQEPLATQKTVGIDAGDWVGIDYDFVEGQEYRILLNSEGEEYVRYRDVASYPYEGDALEVINGSYSPGDQSQTGSYVYNIDRIRASRTGGIGEPEPDYRDINLDWVADYSNASVADDPTGGMRPVVSIDCQPGPPQNYAVDARRDLEDMVGHEPKVAHFRYEIHFPTDFEVHQNMNHGGTKLPGPADHRGGGGAGGNHNPGEAWSARGYATSRGDPHDKTDGDDVPLGKQIYDVTAAQEGYGFMHSWEKGANQGEWVTIDEFYDLGEPGENDSLIRTWVNGEKAFDRDDYQFLDEEHGDKGIHEWRWHFYFGGRWGSPKEQSIYVRRFGIWTGQNCPSM